MRFISLYNPLMVIFAAIVIDATVQNGLSFILLMVFGCRSDLRFIKSELGVVVVFFLS